jgi:hypothetical protein
VLRNVQYLLRFAPGRPVEASGTPNSVYMRAIYEQLPFTDSTNFGLRSTPGAGRMSDFIRLFWNQSLSLNFFETAPFFHYSNLPFPSIPDSLLSK